MLCTIDYVSLWIACGDIRFARSVLNSVEQKAYVGYDTEKGGNYIWARALGASFGGTKEHISIGNL